MSNDKPVRKNVNSCDVCGKKFTNLEKLKVHLTIHSNEAHEQKETIDETFGKKNEFMKNSLRETQTDIKKWLTTCSELESSGIEECQVFEGTSITTNYVKRILFIDKTEKIVSAEGGEAVIKTPSWRSQFCFQARKKNLGNEECDKEFSKETKNIPAHREERQNYFGKCGKTFTRNSTVKKHSVIHSVEKTYICKTCNRAFTRNNDLKRHLHVHTNEKPHICENCGKEFGRKDNLTKHFRTHTKEKPYTCEICNRNFTQKAHLKFHALVHTNEKPHFCEVCGKMFARKEYLAKHLRFHTKDKLYTCGTCNKGFAQKSTLEMHKPIHKIENPHFCEVCGKAFRGKNNLRNHMLVHAEEKPYV